MKFLTILFLLTMIQASSVLAQSQDEKEITASVEALRIAMIEANKSSLENLTAKELSYGHSTAKIESKIEFINIILSEKNDYKKIELSNQTITVIDNIGIVRHTFVAEILTNGEIHTPNLGVLQIWKKQENKWQLLARQAFKL